MSSKRSLLNLLVILSLVAALLVACGPTPEPTQAPEPTEAPAATKAPEAEPTEAAEPPPEPEAAMDEVSQIEFADPVELEFWHTKTGSQEELLNEIVADFNDSNEYGITVVPTSIEGSYDQFSRTQWLAWRLARCRTWWWPIRAWWRSTWRRRRRWRWIRTSRVRSTA